MISYRLATPDDLPQMLDIYAEYVKNTTYSFEYAPPTSEQFAQRYQRIIAFYPWYAVEEDGQVIGYAYADRAFDRAAYGWDADLSIYLAPQAKRKGIGSRLYSMLLRDLTEMGFYTVYALVTGNNTISQAFHEKQGFTIAAVLPDTGYKMGQWLDIFWYEKQLAPREGQPKPVCSYQTACRLRSEPEPAV